MQPQAINDVNLVFPTSVSSLMPPYAEIPDEYRNRRSPYADLTSEWFFSGLSENKIKAKPGIDEDSALRHLSTIMRSFEPKHEHKIAAVAYLMSQWFDIVEVSS
ncbi:hypothetical protein H6F86_21075 [Phormidium sp. FACHB-592]|uniref:Uncharacterized protein n=1 Tax=Stenomitos frigidus AS-A4 TaxID=2933935 RepID=A0ABV0KER4_9CYAN|nr:hypothetical protein [Phormidium sp. FACHB-592]MBD2076328.1 hypothetical protein [Phormidium sp. FACHB-592]